MKQKADWTVLNMWRALVKKNNMRAMETYAIEEELKMRWNVSEMLIWKDK